MSGSTRCGPMMIPFSRLSHLRKAIALRIRATIPLVLTGTVAVPAVRNGIMAPNRLCLRKSMSMDSGVTEWQKRTCLLAIMSSLLMIASTSLCFVCNRGLPPCLAGGKESRKELEGGKLELGLCFGMLTGGSNPSVQTLAGRRTLLPPSSSAHLADGQNRMNWVSFPPNGR